MANHVLLTDNTTKDTAPWPMTVDPDEVCFTDYTTQGLKIGLKNGQFLTVKNPVNVKAALNALGLAGLVAPNVPAAATGTSSVVAPAPAEGGAAAAK